MTTGLVPRSRKYGKVLCTVLTCAAVLSGGVALAQTPSPKEVVTTMLQRERDAASHKILCSYLSNERSERTGGKLWTERVVETRVGRVRLLLAEDGKALDPERARAERARIENDAAHPEAFLKREQAQKDDDARAQQMLDLLTRGFILENIKPLNGDWRIDFRPDPDYSTSGVDEKVLHGMSGWLLIDQKQLRLHYVEGRLPQDVSLFGFLGSIKAGSHFETTKLRVEDGWRTARVVTDIRGKAVFKTIGKSQDVARTEFHVLPAGLTLTQAVALAEK